MVASTGETNRNLACAQLISAEIGFFYNIIEFKHFNFKTIIFYNIINVV
jgi:hypothetical protein